MTYIPENEKFIVDYWNAIDRSYRRQLLYREYGPDWRTIWKRKRRPGRLRIIELVLWGYTTG